MVKHTLPKRLRFQFTALNAYIFSLGKLPHLNLIYYQDNFIAKAAFWPVVLWMMALIS